MALGSSQLLSKKKNSLRRPTFLIKLSIEPLYINIVNLKSVIMLVGLCATICIDFNSENDLDKGRNVSLLITKEMKNISLYLSCKQPL